MGGLGAALFIVFVGGMMAGTGISQHCEKKQAEEAKQKTKIEHVEQSEDNTIAKGQD